MTERMFRKDFDGIGAAMAALMPKHEPMPDAVLCRKCERPLRTEAGMAAVAARLVNVAMDEVPWCQCKARKEAERARRYQHAQLPYGDRTLETFQRLPGTEEALEAAESFLRGSVPVLVMVGFTGCGKTHIAEGIGHRFLEQGRTVRCEYVPDFLDRMRATQARDSLERLDDVLRPAQTADLLVLDEVGSQADSVSEWAAEKITTLVDERIRHNRPLVVTTNQPHGKLVQTNYFRLASRLWDKRSGKVWTVLMDRALDYRTGR